MAESWLQKFWNQFFSPKWEIYTDGSHKGKWGSWAFVIVRNGVVIHESSGRARKTNSHRMEFQAAIEALSYLKAGTKAVLFSDSSILIESALHPEKAPQINHDQVEKIQELLRDRNISWKWVKAHFGIAHNERCDQLCIQAREGVSS